MSTKVKKWAVDSTFPAYADDRKSHKRAKVVVLQTGQVLATYQHTGTYSLFDTKDKALVTVSNPNSLVDFAYSATHLITLHSNLEKSEALQLYDVQQGLTHTWTPWTDSSGTPFSRLIEWDGEQILIVTYHTVFRVPAVKGAVPIKLFTHKVNRPMKNLSSLQQGRLLLCNLHVFQVWDLASRRVMLSGEASALHTILLTCLKDDVMVTAESELVRVWRVDQYDPLDIPLEVPPSSLLVANGRLLVGDFSGRVGVFSLTTGRLLQCLYGHRDLQALTTPLSNSSVYLPGGQVLVPAPASAPSTPRRLIPKTQARVYSLALSADSHTLFIGHSGLDQATYFAEHSVWQLADSSLLRVPAQQVRVTLANRLIALRLTASHHDDDEDEHPRRDIVTLRTAAHETKWKPKYQGSLAPNVQELATPDEEQLVAVDPLVEELVDAASRGAIHLVCSILQRDPSLMTATNQLGASVLFAASRAGHSRLVQLLLRLSPTKLEVGRSHGLTPLLGASAGGHSRVIETLVSSGASMAALDRMGRVAMEHPNVRPHQQLFDRAPLRSYGIPSLKAFLRADTRNSESAFQLALYAQNDTALSTRERMTTMTAALEKASHRSHTDAQYLRGWFAYSSGDYPVAFEWWKAASEGGNRPALEGLGHLFMAGQGVPYDFFRGLDYIKLACIIEGAVGSSSKATPAVAAPDELPVPLLRASSIVSSQQLRLRMRLPLADSISSVMHQPLSARGSGLSLPSLNLAVERPDESEEEERDQYSATRGLMRRTRRKNKLV